MNAKRINIALILTLIVGIIFNAGCSSSRADAQSRSGQTQTTVAQVSESSNNNYKPEKRVSKDIIKKEETPKVEKKIKTKKK